ncbi:S9 family peptidase [Taibaiella sp. KBW10]|uniref:S9 family peptidase n=1 Tax=Taibaiella sp. KBW10 TaxID=2153357 RepID=UPI000F594337|nr:DPP IV N-terminal domain-containing protein [Taibaiella sp. KBW10]RQO32337.1 S9 family peptidase [Taibaiella sp. KBW10]
MKKYILLVSAFIAAHAAQAQDKQFSMKDAVLGLRTNLAIDNVNQLSWLKNEDAFVFNKNNELIKTAVPSMRQTPWISLSGFNQLLFGKDSLKAIPAINWTNSVPYFQLKNDLYFLGNPNANFLVDKPLNIDPKAQNTTIKDRLIAYTIDQNLYLIDAQKNKHTITNDAGSGIKNGQSVHRNEFGIDGGIFISPKNNYVAFYRMDESMVNDYPVIDWASTPAQNENIKYPMAGGKSHEVTVGVYNIATKQTVFLKTGMPKDQYLTCVTWSPDEQSVFVAVLNRAQNHMWLNQYDARTGAFLKTLFEEQDDKYVEPQHELHFLPNSNTEFLWWSQRSGFMHLYRYNVSGKLLNTVTSGAWLVNEIVGDNAKANEVIITATKESAKERHIYAVNWKSGAMKRIDKAAGVHMADANSNGTYILDRYTNATTPRNIEVFNSNGKLVQNILTAKDPLVSYNRPKVEDVTLMADDGTPLFGKIVYPANFDRTKKYPTIVYLYNGPHVQLVTNTYPASGNLWYEYMAQRGYVIFTMDGRGSGNRGQKFEQATFRQLGTVEMNDQLVGVQYLKSLPFVDAARMGVHGWSFGGFMTTSLMLRHPGVFKVGVAGGPVIDWSLYEIMYTERYMDMPQENPKGYADNNLLTKVDQLKGKLLMIHGAQDDVVVWQHSMKFIKACVDKGVQMDYFVYPGHQHNVLGKDRVHLMQKIADYFDDYLK